MSNSSNLEKSLKFQRGASILSSFKQNKADLVTPYSVPSGVWFKVLGNGQRMTATTCFSLGNVVDTVLEVFLPRRPARLRKNPLSSAMSITITLHTRPGLNSGFWHHSGSSQVYEDAGDTCASGLQVVAFNDDFELNVANPGMLPTHLP